MNISKDSAFYRFAAWDKASDFEIKDGCTLYFGALGSAITVAGIIFMAVVVTTIAGLSVHHLQGIDAETALASPVNIAVQGLGFLAAVGVIGYGLFRLARKHCKNIKIV